MWIKRILCEPASINLNHGHKQTFATLWIDIYECTCNSVKRYLQMNCQLHESQHVKQGQTVWMSQTVWMTLSTVQSMPVLHISKSGFVTKTGFHAAWPDCDKYMAMELRTWGAVSFMPTVMKVCVACSLLGMFQAASADLLSPSLDSQSQRYLNVCDISTFKFRTRLFLCGQTRREKKRIQTAELWLSLTIDETGLRTFDHRRHEMLRRRADAHMQI